MGNRFQTFFWVVFLLASTAWGQVTLPALDVTNKAADTTFVRRTSVKSDSFIGDLYGNTDTLGHNYWTSYLRREPPDTFVVLSTLFNDTSIFFGRYAGNAGASRYCNAYGYGAMDSAGGNSNLFNNAFGFEALKMSGSGGASNGNNAFGHKVLNRLTIGIDNNGFGLNVMRDLLDGNNNSVFGDQGLLLAKTGDQNCVLGQSGMLNSDSSSKNIMIGAEAGSHLRGNSNIGIGFQALDYSKRSNFRIAMGYMTDAGAWNDTLRQDTTISIGFKASTDSQGIAIGDSAVALLKNSGAIGNHTTARRQNYFTIYNIDADSLRLAALTIDAVPDSALSVVDGLVKMAAWPTTLTSIDSLHHNYWTAYLRSDVSDTAQGPIYFKTPDGNSVVEMTIQNDTRVRFGYLGITNGTYFGAEGNGVNVTNSSNRLMLGGSMQISGGSSGSPLIIKDDVAQYISLLDAADGRVGWFGNGFADGNFGVAADAGNIDLWSNGAKRLVVTATGDSSELTAQRKVVTSDTLKSSLNYKKVFGNSAANLRDTIICAGVKTDSTIVSPDYIYDSGASTFNALMYYVRPDTIFTIRQAITDPDSFSVLIMKKK